MTRESVEEKSPPTDFAILLERRLSALDIRQHVIAKKLGVRQTYISKLVNGTLADPASPPFEEAGKWAAALGVPEQMVIDAIWSTKHPGVMPPSAAVNQGGYFVPVPEEDRQALEAIARDPVRIIQALVRQAIRGK